MPENDNERLMKEIAYYSGNYNVIYIVCLYYFHQKTISWYGCLLACQAIILNYKIYVVGKQILGKPTCILRVWSW